MSEMVVLWGNPVMADKELAWQHCTNCQLLWGGWVYLLPTPSGCDLVLPNSCMSSSRAEQEGKGRGRWILCSGLDGRKT